MIYVGTSGYGYHEWCPRLYPAGMPHARYLREYARRFHTCELTGPFFEMPSSDESRRLAGEVPEGFQFTVKLFRRLTHERTHDLVLARRFAEALAPLVEAGRLGAVVAQFPYAFVNHPHNRAYLCRLRAALELPLVAELRNPSWLRDDTQQFLRGWGIGWVSIDAPPGAGLCPPVSTTTSRLGYVRFHGRDAARWWRREETSRYAYRYRRRELIAWIPRVREIARKTGDVFVLFNNYRDGNAWENAAAFAKLLERGARRGAPRPAAAARVG